MKICKLLKFFIILLPHKRNEVYIPKSLKKKKYLEKKSDNLLRKSTRARSCI